MRAWQRLFVLGRYLSIALVVPGCADSGGTGSAVAPSGGAKVAVSGEPWDEEFTGENWADQGLPYLEPAAAQVKAAVGARSSPASKLLHRFRGHTGGITSVGFSPSGREAISASEDGTVRIWETATGKELRTFSQVGGAPRVVLISHDGERLIVAGGDNVIRILRPADGNELYALAGHKAPIYWLRISRDDRFMVSVDVSGSIFVWTFSTDGRAPQKRQLGFGFRFRGERVFPVFSNDNTKLLATFGCRRLISWTTDNWRREDIFEIYRAAAPNAQIAEIPAGPYFALATRRTVRLIYPKRPPDRSIPGLKLPVGHDTWVESPALVTTLDSIRSLVPLGGGKVVAALGGDGAVEYWRPEMSETAGQFPAETQGVTATALHPSDFRTLTGHKDGSLTLWQIPKPSYYAEETASHVAYEFVEMFRARNYDKLEETIDKYRKERTRLDNGELASSLFYATLSTPRNEQEDWKSHFEEIQMWEQAKPESIAARLVRAGSLVRHGWAARGGGFAYTVTADGWKAFHADLTEAKEVLRQAASLKPVDMRLHELLVTVHMGLSDAREETAAAFEHGHEIDPSYDPLYETMAVHLLPRWGGAQGEVAAWAKEVCDKLPEHGDEIYARIACNLVGYESDDFFDALGMDYRRIMRGLQQMKGDFTKSQHLLNSAALFSCLKLDLETARPLLEKIGNRWEPNVWKHERRFRIWQIWAKSNVPRGQDKRTIVAHALILRSIQHSADGSLMVSVSRDSHGAVKLWDAAHNYEKLVEVPTLETDVQDAALHPTVPLLAMAAGDFSDTIRRHGTVDSRSGKPLLDALVGGDGGYVVAWPLADIGRLSVLYRGPADHVRFSRDGTKLAAACRDNKLRVWTLKTGNSPLELPLSNKAIDLAIAPNGKTAAVRLASAVELIDIESGEKYTALQDLGEARKNGLQFSSDGALLAVTDAKRGPILWDVATKKLRARLAGVKDTPLCVAFSPDGRLLATGSLEGGVRLWHTSTAKELYHFEGHWSMVTAVDFTDGGRTLASAAVDGAIKLWDIAGFTVK